MSESLKKIVIIVSCIVLAAIGYYVVTKEEDLTDLNANVELRETLINKSEAFIEHRSRLEQIQFDQNFFTDSTFTSLRSFSTPVPDQPVGREDIFDEAADIPVATPSESEQ